MPNTRFVQQGETISYVPSSAVLAGAIVALGGLLGIATEPIAAGRTGAVAIAGVFAAAKATSVVTFALGDAVFWDRTNSVAVRTGGSNHYFLGTCTRAAVATDAWVEFQLAPHGLPAFMQGKLWEDVDISGGSKTLDAEDIGKVLNVTVGHASNVITLPATSAVYDNLCIRVGTSGQRVAISPNAVDKIMGPNIAGVDDTDMIMAAATSEAGDYVALAYGGADGWAVVGRRGTFT